MELHMLQRLLDTTSLTGGQWVTVLALSLIARLWPGVRATPTRGNSRGRLLGSYAVGG